MGPKGTDSGLEGSKDKKHKRDKYEQWLQFRHTCSKEEVKVFKLSSQYLASYNTLGSTSVLAHDRHRPDLPQRDSLHQPAETTWAGLLWGVSTSQSHHHLHGNHLSYCFASSDCLCFCCASFYFFGFLLLSYSQAFFSLPSAAFFKKNVQNVFYSVNFQNLFLQSLQF